MKLTDNEIAALKICLNYDDREAQLEDNFSNGGPREFADQIFGGNLRAAGGLITSLHQKGLGDLDDRTGEGWGHQPIDMHIFWLSELGVNTIFDIIEAE